MRAHRDAWRVAHARERGAREPRVSSLRAAFVDFEDEGKAAVARAGLQDFKISEGHNMQIAFAKR